MLQLNKLLVIFKLASLIVQVHAQSSPSSGGLSLPSCAINCLETAISNDGCDSTDFACHCSKASEFVAEIETCVLQQCALSGQDFGNAFVQECASLSGITVSVPSAATATPTTVAVVTSVASSSTVPVTPALASTLAATVSSVPSTTATNPTSSSALASKDTSTPLASFVVSTQAGTTVAISSTTVSSSAVHSEDVPSLVTTSGPTTTMVSSASLSSTPEENSALSSTASTYLLSSSPITSSTPAKTIMFIPITIPTKLSTVTNPSVLVSFFIQSAILSTSSVFPASSSATASVTTLAALNPTNTNGTMTESSTASTPLGPAGTGTGTFVGSSTPSLSFSTGDAPGGLPAHCFGLIIGTQLLLAIFVLRI